MIFNNKSIIFIIYIPKTGGNYIENKLCSKYSVKKKWTNPSLDILFGFYKLNNYNFFVLQHLTFTEMIKYKFINYNNQYIFTIIRNPYDRFLSLYNGWFNYYNSIDLFIDELEKMSINDYEHNGIISNKEKINYKSLSRNLSEIKYFVMPQYYYIENTVNDTNYNIHIFKFKDMEKINKILDLNIKYQEKKKINY